MYVCICNAITDKQIREAAKAGVTDLWGLQARLGVATNCGSCKEMASEILRENRPAKNCAGLRGFFFGGSTPAACNTDILLESAVEAAIMVSQPMIPNPTRSFQ
jgi:bacterioferritin-associated ferredoxin